MAYWEYPRYVRVGERRAKAERKLAQLKKKNPHIRPVVLEGRTLARTWWGKAWNKNLERYADYANRIGRGRSYVRHRAVLDLQIEAGLVAALVQGTESKPYRVMIKIQTLAKKTWKAVKEDCAGRLDSLQDLLAGRFPRALAEIFTAQGRGLFPSPQEIHFSCSCPDWAYMCKHVAAVLYGIGARLDEDPALFFILRKVNMDDLVAETVRETAGHLLQKADKERKHVIAEADLGDLFGIEMEDRMDAESNPPAIPEPDETKPRKRKTAKKRPASAQKSKKGLDEDRKKVIDMIRRSSSGVDVPTLNRKTGVNPIKIRNIIYSAHKKGTIEKVARGIYRAKAVRRKPADETDAVLRRIDQSPKGIGIQELHGQTNVPKPQIRAIVSLACRRGRITRISRGVYAAKINKTARSSASSEVLALIAKHKSGIRFPALKKKTGFGDRKLRNIIFRLKKLGEIESAARGLYVTTK